MSRQLILFVSCLGFLCAVVTGQEQLECYACSYNYNPDVDPVCVTDPDHPDNNPGTVRCNTTNGRSCYIKSQYDKEADHLRSFQRGCEVFNDIPLGCTESTHFLDCLEVCHENLCNGNPLFTTTEPYTGTKEDDNSAGDIARACNVLAAAIVLTTVLCSSRF